MYQSHASRLFASCLVAGVAVVGPFAPPGPAARRRGAHFSPFSSRSASSHSTFNRSRSSQESAPARPGSSSHFRALSSHDRASSVWPARAWAMARNSHADGNCSRSARASFRRWIAS